MIKITVSVTRGEEAQQPGEHWCQQHHEDATSDHRAVDRGDAVLAADRNHRRDGGEGAALHQGQAYAEPPEADRLDQRGDAGNQQVGADQVWQVAGLQLALG